MSGQLQFDLVSPEKQLASDLVSMVVVPGIEGEFGVLPKHIPFVTEIAPGVVRTYKDGKVCDSYFVSSGFVNVFEDRCTILADLALNVSDLNKKVTQDELKMAEESLASARSELDKQKAQKAILVARAKLSAIPQ